MDARRPRESWRARKREREEREREREKERGYLGEGLLVRYQVEAVHVLQRVEVLPCSLSLSHTHTHTHLGERLLVGDQVETVHVLERVEVLPGLDREIEVLGGARGGGVSEEGPTSNISSESQGQHLAVLCHIRE